jgi:hypothetical protein
MTPTTTTDAATRSAEAHRKNVKESLPSLVGFLVDLLGAKLTAHLAGVNVSTVSRWRTGATPSAETERKLRATHQIAKLILTVDADHTARAWFIGMNPQLDDEAPLDVLAEGHVKEALSAARSFVASA